MKFGLLRIKLPDGQAVEFPLDQPAATVGRAQGNDLILDDTSVSRRHARLSVESGRLMLEDLGSANGTFIGGQRIAANTPSLVSEDQPVRLGDVEVRFVAPPPVEPSQAFGPPPGESAQGSAGGGPAVVPAGTPVGPPVSISLVGPAQPVMPGSAATATLTVQNRGAVVDELAIRVAGVPAAWVRLSKDRVPLLPNAQEQVAITFQPPRTSEATAGDHRITVTVVSREHRTQTNAAGALKVLPFQSFEMSVQPPRGRRDFQLVLENRGNAPVAYRFEGTDDEHSLDFRFGQERASLKPGQTGAVPLRVAPKVKPSIGTREVRAFGVVAMPLDPNGTECTAAGQLVIRPPIPVWLIPLVVLVFLCSCVASAYAYVTLCPTYAPDVPFCPAGAKPLVNFFTATPLEVTAGGTVVLAWDVSNAEQVEINPVPGTVDAAGQFVVNPEQSTVYTLSATSFAGTTEQSVEVKVSGVAPTVQEFTSNPLTLVKGQTAEIVISWVAPGADSVSITGVPGTFTATGSANVSAPGATTVYRLTATNASGTASQDLTVTVIDAGCTVTGVLEGDQLNVRDGPGADYPIIEKLSNGDVVVPLVRTSTGEWLKVQANAKEGWASTNFIACAVDVLAFATVSPSDVAPPPATQTPVPSATATATPLPTPTATPVFASGGAITYRKQEGGRTAYYLQRFTGGPVVLLADKDDIQLLDRSPKNGGLFALLAFEGGAQNVYIIREDGGVVRGGINPGWSSVTDGDWSPDAQHLVIEAVAGGAPRYYYFDAAGNLTGNPAFP